MPKEILLFEKKDRYKQTFKGTVKPSFKKTLSPNIIMTTNN